MKSNKHFPKYGKQKIRILTTDFWKCQGVFSLFLVFFFRLCQCSSVASLVLVQPFH